MPTVEKVRGGRVMVRGIGRFEVGDQAEISEADAEYLIEERGDFEYVNGDNGDDFSIDGWLDNDYENRAEAVREGGVDDYLDEIEDAETSQTVIDAVEERRSELEG